MRVVAVVEELHILVSPLNSAFVDVPVPTKPLHAIDGGICTPADRAERERIEDNGRVAYALLTISSPLAVRDCLQRSSHGGNVLGVSFGRSARSVLLGACKYFVVYF